MPDHTRYDDVVLLDMLHRHENLGDSAATVGARHGINKNMVLGMFFRVRKAHEAIQCACRKPENRDGGMPALWWAKAGAP